VKRPGAAAVADVPVRKVKFPSENPPLKPVMPASPPRDSMTPVVQSIANAPRPKVAKAKGTLTMKSNMPTPVARYDRGKSQPDQPRKPW
jgi:hypothetical protein